MTTAADRSKEGRRVGGDGVGARMAYALVVVGVLGATTAANSLAADNATKVRVQDGQSLRDIAQQQLG